MHFIMSHQKWDTKVLKKKLNPSDLLDQWLKWETENTHLRGKKVSLQLCSFLASLVCTEKKPVILLCKRETVHQAVLITVLVWAGNSLRCHPQVLCSPSFSADWVYFVITAVRRNCEDGLLAMAMPGHVLWGRNLRLSSFPCMQSWLVCFILQRNSFLPLHF